MEEYFGILCEGNYIPNGEINQWMQSRLLELCEQLRHELAALVDVFAPPDHILNSVLGNSDGNVYQAIYQTLLKNKQTFITPKYLLEKSKL